MVGEVVAGLVAAADLRVVAAKGVVVATEDGIMTGPEGEEELSARLAPNSVPRSSIRLKPQRAVASKGAPITSRQDSRLGVGPRTVLALARVARCAQPKELECPVFAVRLVKSLPSTPICPVILPSQATS